MGGRPETVRVTGGLTILHASADGFLGYEWQWVPGVDVWGRRGSESCKSGLRLQIKGSAAQDGAR